MSLVTDTTQQTPEQQIQWLSVIWSAGLFVLALIYLVPLTEPVRLTVDWLPALGINLTFYIDGLSRMFILLITGIGAFIFLFSGNYLHGHPHFERFFLYLHLFMLAMLGVVVADNLITLFIFWELTSFTSYLLIGFSHQSAKSRRAALQGLLVTGAGGLCLLAGLVLMGLASGSFTLSEILSDSQTLHDHPWAPAIIILVGLGALTKSAQFPFHFWLPNAMEAPTPVSAFLHSATMVKAGIYLLARLHPELSEAELWMPLLATSGAITAVLGAVLALKQRDLKKMLAYTTLMALGTLTALLSQPNEAVFAAAMTFLVAHALYKATLFLSVGAIDHTLGSKTYATVQGLWQRHRLFALAWLLALLSLAGLAASALVSSARSFYTTDYWKASTASFLADDGLACRQCHHGCDRMVAYNPDPEETPLGSSDPIARPEIYGPIVMALAGIVLRHRPQWIDIPNPATSSVASVWMHAMQSCRWAFGMVSTSAPGSVLSQWLWWDSRALPCAHLPHPIAPIGSHSMPVGIVPQRVRCLLRGLTNRMQTNRLSTDLHGFLQHSLPLG